MFPGTGKSSSGLNT